MFVQVIGDELDRIARPGHARLLLFGHLDHGLQEDRRHRLVEVRAHRQIGELLVATVFVLASALPTSFIINYGVANFN